MIEFVGLTKSYAKSKVKAIDNLTFTVNNGEIFGFLGPNGAGKTTTIKILAGILNSDSGTTTIDGIDIAKNQLQAKHQISYVSDNPDFLGGLKANEYLNFVGDVYGVDTATRQARVEEYSTIFDIKNVLSSKINSFSHGMKQKLLLTASLISDPQNWILDEPMVGLDPKSAFSLKEIMRRRASEGKAVFFSTHVMEVAEKMCDRIAIIDKGKIIFSGTLSELKTKQGENESLEKLFMELVNNPEGN